MYQKRLCWLQYFGKSSNKYNIHDKLAIMYFLLGITLYDSFYTNIIFTLPVPKWLIRIICCHCNLLQKCRLNKYKSRYFKIHRTLAKQCAKVWVWVSHLYQLIRMLVSPLLTTSFLTYNPNLCCNIFVSSSQLYPPRLKQCTFINLNTIDWNNLFTLK